MPATEFLEPSKVPREKALLTRQIISRVIFLCLRICLDIECSYILEIYIFSE